MRMLPVVLALFLGACSETDADGFRLYDNSDLVLVTGYTAKETCSCIFVMEQSEEFCRRWTRADPAVATAHVDFAGKTVTSSALGFWDAKAKFMGEQDGCVIVP